MTDLHWMQRALDLAREAETAGEVPVGAVVVCNGELVSQAWNRPIATNDPTAHAEILALRAAAARHGNYRLSGCDLYVTLEPCAMCAGAIIHARIRRVIFAADDPKAGAAGSVFNILDSRKLNHYVEIQRGLYAEESAELLQTFFRARRGSATA
jgi:tRNA(adenine34) deaminase